MTAVTNIDIPDANGVTRNVNTLPGRGSTTKDGALPVTIATDDTILGYLDGVEGTLATINALLTTQAGYLDGVETALAPLSTAATSAKQDSTITAINSLTGTEYETVAASATNQALGAAGGAGDLLVSLLIIPATTSPGAVSIKDGAGSAITVFTGGASSLVTLHPFTVPLGLRSTTGAWSVTTGTNVSVIAAGDFT